MRFGRERFTRFLQRWKGADAEIPILKEARAEAATR
jgi:hypothetical protein